MIDKDKLISLLISKEIPVKTTRRYKTIGYRIKLESGTAVYVYDSGGFFVKEITLIRSEKPSKMKSLMNQTTKFSLFTATIKPHETNSNVFSKS